MIFEIVKWIFAIIGFLYVVAWCLVLWVGSCDDSENSVIIYNKKKFKENEDEAM